MSEQLDIQAETPTVEPVTTETAPEQPTTEQVEQSPAKEQPAVEGATTSDEAQQEEVKKRTGFQKRIDELTRQRYERDHQIQALQAQIESIQQQNQQFNAEATKPTIDQYDYDAEKWSQAYEHWMANQQKQQAEQQQAAQQQAHHQQQQLLRQQKLQEKIYAAEAQNPGFMQTINDPSLPNLQEINAAAYEAVLESDNLGAVAMHLAKNPEKVYSFAQMSPVQAIREVALLEAKLGNGAPQSPKPPPPPPATDIRGKSDVRADPRKMSTEQYIAWRNEQQMKR